MAIKIEELADVLNEAQAPKEIYNAVMEKAQELENNKKEEREIKATKQKNQFVVVSKGSGEDTVSHIFSIPAEDDPATLIDKIKQSAVEHNLGQKRKKCLVTEFDDVVHIKRKYSKAVNYQLKTKSDWVRTIVLTPEMEKIAESIKVD